MLTGTRLLTEASLQTRIGDDRFLSSNCREHAALPYQPFIDILNPLLSDLPQAVKEALPVELARLLPGMADASNEPVTLDQAEARLRLFTAFWEVLRQSAHDRALMLVVEDGQWADPTTLELFGYLAHQVKQARILLILTYRLEEVEFGAPSGTLQRDLQRSGTARTLTLDLLNRDHVADFLRAALGREDMPSWLIDSFYQATGDNPLFMEETLKALAAEGEVAKWTHADSSRWRCPSSMTLQLPQNVLALAERRLQLLSAGDRPILTAAAVLGPEFSFTLLQGITKLDEDTLLDAIDRLLAARLIEELPLQDGEDRYRFGQEALRQVLLNTISQRRLRGSG